MRTTLPLFVAISITSLMTSLGRCQSVNDGSLNVQTFASGLDSPTGMAFINSTDALAIEKNSGKVQLLHNGVFAGTVLDLPVANDSERGLLSITPSPHFSSDHFLYLYYTASQTDGGDAIENRIVRYRWNPGSETLTLNRRVIDLPATPGPNHMGGKVAFSKDGRLFTVIGDANHDDAQNNNLDSHNVSDNGVVLRLYTNGAGVKTNPFYKSSRQGTRLQPLNEIYAYGIRNSFGMAPDPVTGDMWMSENGPDVYDEINRLSWGFNGGWNEWSGPLSRQDNESTNNLRILGAHATYHDPQFAWKKTVAPTDMIFSNGSLGGGYTNDMFVGDINGVIYHFDMTGSRKALRLSGVLRDGVADNSENDFFGEMDAIRFGSNFGTITDLINGPDGLYVVSLGGDIFKISDGSGASPQFARMFSMVLPEPGSLGTLMLSLLLLPRGCRRSHCAVRQ